jgi:hypothetical protein
MVKATAHFVAAAAVGCVLGNLLAIVAALGIDASYGASVTGGAWALSVPNVIYSAAIGFLVGSVAGLLHSRRGWLVAVVAQFLPMAFAIAVSVYLNRDLLDGHRPRPSTWTWIGAVPALAGGWLASKLARDDEAMHVLKAIRWNWLWLWVVLLANLYFIAGSIRFLLADLVLGWKALFVPRLWLPLVFGAPIIGGLLYATFSVPVVSTGYLLKILSEKSDPYTGVERKNRVAKILFAVIGAPAGIVLVWFLNGIVLSWLAANGLEMP